MSKHIETKHKIKEIADLSSFYQLIDKATLSAEDKTLLKYIYIDRYNFSLIGDKLGYSESTIKKKHKRILGKLSRML